MVCADSPHSLFFWRLKFSLIQNILVHVMGYLKLQSSTFVLEGNASVTLWEVTLTSANSFCYLVSVFY